MVAMSSTVLTMYRELEKCVDDLEENVHKSLIQTLGAKTYDENVVALESSKDYHYKEILKQLQEIRGHIKKISEHDKSLKLLENKVESTTIDKNYIKKQVESFQNIGTVNRRERKLVRPRETSSMRFLECWERMLEEQESNELPQVHRRTNNPRNSKKIVSSTVETFLESPTEKSVSLESLVEEAVAIEETCNKTETFSEAPTEKCVSLESLVEEAVTVEETCNNNETFLEAPTEKSVSFETEEGVTIEETCNENEDTKPRIIDVIFKKPPNGHI